MGNIPPSLLRQPPPPLRHHPSLMAGNKEEGNRDVVGGNCTRTYYSRRCKRERLTNIESLADDLLFEILLHVSAQDIYDPARLVCRKWYHMIHTQSFIYAHLWHTNYGILFHSIIKGSFFMAMRQGRVEISEFSYKFRCPVWASCNGLILEFELFNQYALYIANPVTKQIFVLPPLSFKLLNYDLCGMAYAAASMEYKVVVTYPANKKSKGLLCAILTVGVDNSWRNVCTDHLSLPARRVFVSAPLITEGFLHWAMSGNHVLTLNVETEIITETPAPIPQHYGHHRSYLSTGEYLSLLINSGEFLWEVWEMTPETAEWRKLPDIALEAQKSTFERFDFKHDEYLKPVGWLKYLEVLVFSVSGKGRAFVFCYNLLTQEINSIELPSLSKFYRPLVHRNSLVWLGGC